MRVPSRPTVPRRAPFVLAVAVLTAAAPAAPHDPPAPGTKVYRVPSSSMAPTIASGQNILVRLFSSPDRARPKVGTIVVAHPPAGATGDRACADSRNLRRGRPCGRSVGGRSDEQDVQRIVAGPGDTVAFRKGVLVRYGQPVPEPYISDTCANDRAGEGPCHLPRAITLARNRYFLARDNRGESNDSRLWGPIPRAWMVGEVTEIGVPPPTLFR